MTMTSEKALDKVRKLLALGNNEGATEGERDNAIRMAQALLLKFNLDEDDLDIKELREKLELKGEAAPWARTIANSIAKLYFCNYFYQKGRSGPDFRHVFVGKTSNVTTANMISDFVIRSILKEGGKRKRDEDMSPAWRTSFNKGAAASIYKKCNDLLAAQSKDTFTKGNGTSIVLASFYESEKTENANFIKDELGYNLKTTASRARPAFAHGYNDGANYGSGLGLNTQVASGNGQLRIGR